MGPPARVLHTASRTLFDLPSDGCIAVGTSKNCEISVALPGAIERHCLLVCSRGKIEVHDLSDTGVFINNKAVSKEGDGMFWAPSVDKDRVLRHGDRLHFEALPAHAMDGADVLVFMGSGKSAPTLSKRKRR